MPPALIKKKFVLDTNVILHDSESLKNFAEHDIIIPITVLEELDNFKKGNDSLNFHAREFTRKIDALSSDKLFKNGVSLGDGLGKISVRMDSKFDKNLMSNFNPRKADHQILNTAYQVSIDHPNEITVLVTKDVNLRVKARAIGLVSQDYKNDHVTDVKQLYPGIRILSNLDEDIISDIYKKSYGINLTINNLEKKILPNEYLILRSDKKSALGCYDFENDIIRHVDKTPAFGIIPRNAEQIFALDAILNNEIRLVSLTGKAGTGKTLLALAGSLKRKKNYRQILMARPIVALSNKDIGYLPGDIQSKLDPYMKPLFDNLAVIEHNEGTNKKTRVSKLLDDNFLIIEPLSYIRGRSLVNTCFIIDEAQNLTPHEIKTIITRAGEGTKIIFTGDIFQIDHPYLNSHSNGLAYLIEKMKGQKIYAHVNLNKGERSELADLAGNIL